MGTQPLLGLAGYTLIKLCMTDSYFANAVSYQLNYDGIVSPKLIIEEQGGSSSSLVKKVTNLVASSFNDDQNHDNALFEVNCFLPQTMVVPGEDEGISMGSTKCIADYIKPGFIMSHLALMSAQRQKKS